MALKIIGSGFGRTGTKSVKLALEQLGFAPCHHMSEVTFNPDQIQFWSEISEGKPVDWNAVFNGFQAAVDWPSCNYWRQLAEAFPNAKVIHTTRPFAQWWKSFSGTIAESLMTDFPTTDPIRLRHLRTKHRIITQDVFGGRVNEEAAARDAFERREAEVRVSIAPERLLVMQPGDGWEKLCPFLGVSVPEKPYPFTNTTEEFRTNMKAIREQSRK